MMLPASLSCLPQYHDQAVRQSSRTTQSINAASISLLRPFQLSTHHHDAAQHVVAVTARRRFPAQAAASARRASRLGKSSLTSGLRPSRLDHSRTRKGESGKGKEGKADRATKFQQGRRPPRSGPQPRAQGPAGNRWSAARGTRAHSAAKVDVSLLLR